MERKGKERKEGEEGRARKWMPPFKFLNSCKQ